MEIRINELEEKINQLINNYKQLKNENRLLKSQLLEKETKLKEFEENKAKAINKLDNLIEILKKEETLNERS